MPSKEKRSDADGKVKLPSFLKKDLDFKELSLAGKKSKEIPTKTTMNLVQKVKTDNSMSRVIPTAIILALIVILFCKFAVIDRLIEWNQAENRLSSSQAMLDECNDKLKDYADVKERYYRYTDEFKTDEEAILFSRPAILDIITNSTGTQGTVQSFSVTDNDVNFVVYTSNLDEVAVIRQRLESMPDVHDVAVYSATKSENNITWVNSSIKFSVGEEPQPEPEEPAAGESEVDENA